MLIAAFLSGFITGVFLMCLLVISRDDNPQGSNE